MAASDDPPGYADAPARSQAFAIHGVLLACTLIATAQELLVRQSQAYLAPGFGPPRGLVGWAAVGSGLAAALLAWRARLGARALPWISSALSVLTSASGLLWFFAFGDRRFFAAAAWGLSGVAAALIGAVGLLVGTHTLARAAHADALRPWLRPFRLFGFGLTLALIAGLLSVVGLMRGGATLGAVLAALTLGFPGRASRPASYTALGLAGLSFWFAERLVPVHEIRAYPADVVYTAGGERQRHVVVSTQRMFELFSDGLLRATSLDGHRYAECLAHPSLLLAERRDDVLVLGSADGLVEREVLRYRDVRSLTVVTADRTPRALVERALWAPGRAPLEPPPSSARLRVIEAEPIVWLGKGGGRFDAILVDLPDPARYRDGKNFTVHFYRQLAKRLAPGGSLAVQVTSPHGSPEAFSSIVRTLEAAGLSPLPYAAPVSSLGVWGFALVHAGSAAPRTPIADREALRVLAELRYLDGPRLLALFQLAPDERPLRSAPSNTLPEQPVVEILQRERAELGL